MTQKRIKNGRQDYVEISVSDVRNAIYFSQSSCGEGRSSRADLGTVFHRFMASLLVADEQDLCNLFSRASQESWALELKDFAYRKTLGPYLMSNAAALNGHGENVLDLWTALGEATDWLVQLFWDYRQRQLREGCHFNPRDFVGWFQTEVPLRLELTDPAWTKPVVLLGIADTVLSAPNGRCCVIEYKLGKTSPEVDLCQTALYHWMSGASDQDSLAVISFLPEKSEQVLSGTQLTHLHQQLKTLIGKLAGVARAPIVRAGSNSLEHSVGTPAAAGKSLPTQATNLAEMSKRLRSALGEAGCEASFVCDPVVGPTFIRFTLNPARGVSPKKFLSSGEILQLRLQLERPPVIQTGSSITIDVQRLDREFVPWSSIDLPQSKPIHGCSELLVGVGLDGELRTADLADTASYHMLVAGTSGSGKSEWLRTAVAGLIATNTPQTLQLVAIDPKRVAFHDLQGSPYLRHPVVFPGDSDAEVMDVLDELIDEMERRYALLEGAASLAELIDRTGKSIPRIVCVCDEYADLMLGSTAQRTAIENRITRLGAKARASGIHLILATQQPSRRTITGAIQTNLPGRVGLTMTSAVESRMLLGEPGAENLLLKGDLLYKDIGPPKRYQAVFLPDEERKRLFSASEAVVGN
ncbi:FtsK/SpoIIIE domain-containing protein [Planctomycetaceae bacterium SH139]